MIVKVENREIKEIGFGEGKNSYGYISVPDDWGTEEIEKFLINGKMVLDKTSYRVDEDKPGNPFKLREIR